MAGSHKKIRMIPYRAYSNASGVEMYQRGALNIKHFSGLNSNCLLPSKYENYSNEEDRNKDVGLNFREYGTDRRNGSSSFTAEECKELIMPAATRRQLSVIGDVRNIFDNDNDKGFGFTMVNSNDHTGVVMALGAEVNTTFIEPQLVPYRVYVPHDKTRATLLQDVIGVGFHFNYFGSHDGAKDVHPYILRTFMLYGVHFNGTYGDSGYSTSMSVFAREIEVDLWGTMSRDTDSKSDINSKVFSYGGRLSDNTIRSLKDAGLMGPKDNRPNGGFRTRPAYWLGLAWKIKWKSKMTSNVTRTIHFNGVRPICSDTTDMSTTRAKDWVIPNNPDAFPTTDEHRNNRRNQFLYY